MNPRVIAALFVGAVAWLVRAATKKSTAEAVRQPTAKSVEQPRAFISFDFDHDRNHKVMFAGQCSKNSPTPFTAQDWSSKEALPNSTWEETIFEKIGRCHMMFILVSPTAHKAVGVAKEIEMAAKQNVPFFGVYVAGASTSTELPKGMSRNRTVEWDWAKLKTAITQMLQEGKNRKR